MTRGVEDTLLVLQAIYGPDPGDAASVPSHLDFDAGANLKGLRVGYFPGWMKERPATEVDRAALETIRKVGMTPVEVSIPDWPYDSLNLILFAEGAAAFEELTLSGGLRELKAQVPDAWPNLFRQARFLWWSTLFRRTDCAAKSLWKWLESSLRSICCLFLLCAMRCWSSPTSRGILRSRCERDL